MFDATTIFAVVRPGKRGFLKRRLMCRERYTSATPRREQQMVLSLTQSAVRERRLDSERVASPVALIVREKELLLRCKVQVVRRPAKRGRPALSVT
jgi:hypothetical protein